MLVELHKIDGLNFPSSLYEIISCSRVVDVDADNHGVETSPRWNKLVVYFLEINSICRTSSFLSQGEATPVIIDNHLLEIVKRVLGRPVSNVMDVSLPSDIITCNFSPFGTIGLCGFI